MANENRPVRCAPNANIKHGPVDELICTPEKCRHYEQCKNLENSIRGRFAREAIQKSARENGRFPFCRNPWR